MHLLADRNPCRRVYATHTGFFAGLEIGFLRCRYCESLREIESLGLRWSNESFRKAARARYLAIAFRHLPIIHVV